jgi:hypothetical protein
MLKYLTGAAALALAASSLHADPGGGHGKGGGGDKGGGNPHAMSAPGGGCGQGHGKSAEHGNSGGQGHAKAAKADRGPGNGNGNERGPSMAASHGKPVKAEKAVEHGRADRDFDGRGRDRNDDRDVRVVRADNDRDRFDFGRVERRGLVDGCPPGLAKKNNGCMPPGQLKQARVLGFANRPDWWGFDDDRFDDGRFAFLNGSLVRLSDNGAVSGFLPLLGGALAPGNVWPSYYAPVTLPAYYQDYYGLGPVDSYRFYDNALYGIDPQTQAITSIAALLTGDNFAVGQPLPLGYDVYNVPYSYRDRYVDGPDSLYRYSDGYVYQVDPTTQLITAAIQLLT